MKQTLFIVTFLMGEPIKVRAMSPYQAYILACAEKVQNAMPCNPMFVKNEEHDVIYEIFTEIKLVK